MYTMKNLPSTSVPETPKSTHRQQMTLVFMHPSCVYKYTHMNTHMFWRSFHHYIKGFLSLLHSCVVFHNIDMPLFNQSPDLFNQIFRVFPGFALSNNLLWITLNIQFWLGVTSLWNEFLEMELWVKSFTS